MLKTSTVSLLGMLVILPTTLYAFPPICETGEYYKAYVRGLDERNSYFTNLWARYNDCEKIRPYIAAIDVEYRAARSQEDSCYNAGAAEALYDQLKYIASYCSVQCLETAETIGRLQAEAFCVVGPMYSARTLPVRTIPVCNQTQLTTCQQTFEGFTSNRCSNYVGSVGYRWAIESGCRQPT